MNIHRFKRQTCNYLDYALTAFAGLGLEILLNAIVEPILFGNIGTNNYTDIHKIIHWILTIICWGLIIVLLIHESKTKLKINILEDRAFTKQGAAIAVLLAVACIALNAYDWGTLKIIGEFQRKELILFVFQYIYYIFEMSLVFLIVVFGQKFAEKLLNKESKIPFGVIVLCCTWGVVHILSKGSIYTGIGVMIFALLYGEIYILLNRNAKYSYLAMLLAFII